MFTIITWRSRWAYSGTELDYSELTVDMRMYLTSKSFRLVQLEYMARRMSGSNYENVEQVLAIYDEITSDQW